MAYLTLSNDSQYKEDVGYLLELTMVYRVFTGSWRDDENKHVENPCVIGQIRELDEIIGFDPREKEGKSYNLALAELVLLQNKSIQTKKGRSRKEEFVQYATTQGHT